VDELEMKTRCVKASRIIAGGSSMQPRARPCERCTNASATARARRTLETGYASAGTNAFTRLDLIK